MSVDYVVESEFLYNNQGNHDKVYNVALYSKGDIHVTYEVIAEYGARTSVLKQISKYNGSSLTAARNAYHNLIAEKVNKGYRVVNSDRSGRSTLARTPAIQNKPAQKKEVKKKEEAKKETFDPNAIPERRLDFDDL